MPRRFSYTHFVAFYCTFSTHPIYLKEKTNEDDPELPHRVVHIVD